MQVKRKNKEQQIIVLFLVLYFALFQIVPLCALFMKSFQCDSGVGISNYADVILGKGFARALGNSFMVSAISASITTILAFFLSYAIHYTNIHKGYKKVISAVAQLPMLLPTITYGFAIMYSFGKQGLLTRLFGRQFFEIYGLNGLLIGYVIYTLPVAFLLIQNTMQYIDKSFMVVSRVMGDRPIRTFAVTILQPLTGTLVSAFIQAFFLCFTDFGIPAAVGGTFETIASVLYREMLGSVPDFGRGAVVALAMLLPSVVSISILHRLEKYNVRYTRTSHIEVKANKTRDIICAIGATIIMSGVVSIFAVIFVIPFSQDWPYYTSFTFKHIKAVFSDTALVRVLRNSLTVSLSTALFGTLIAYFAALVTERSNMSQRIKAVIEGIAMVTNTIPGMVLGLAFLFVFTGTPLQGTIFLIIVCNIVHYFSTPYMMMKNSLSKMNASWESTGMLMGDRWMATIIRVVTPNAFATILEVFLYYFINSMVTISAVIFIAGARSMVITTKIKELQYYNKFNEIFVLSLLILFINLVCKIVFQQLVNKKTNTRRERRNEKKNG